MKAEVFPSDLSGTVTAPGSKSIAQRMVACALLSKGETTISNYPDSADCTVALAVAQALGAVITTSGSAVKIRGGFPQNFISGIRNPKSEVFCGESGLASRMFMPIAALAAESFEFKGSGSLLNRPFDSFEKIFPQLQAQFNAHEGKLPVIVKGPIKAADFSLDASDSSQFLTGLLLALPRAIGDSRIEVSKLNSRPYIDMTVEVAKMFGVDIKHRKYEHFNIKGGQNFQPGKFVVPGDWSGAAMLLVAGALSAEKGLLVENISTEISQADDAILDALKSAGINFEVNKNSVMVFQSEVRAFDFDANHCPDLFPPLAALAAFADGVSTIQGAKRLIHKESNRAKVLQDEFGKAGVRIVVRDDEMKIYPGSIRAAVLNSHNDHRIAMAASILGLAGAKTMVKGAECVSKSFPGFFQVIKAAKGKVTLS
jgi:3-phosphoshikimate 1-carboxyvinyltransferase